MLNVLLCSCGNTISLRNSTLRFWNVIFRSKNIFVHSLDSNCLGGWQQKMWMHDFRLHYNFLLLNISKVLVAINKYCHLNKPKTKVISNSHFFSFVILFCWCRVELSRVLLWYRCNNIASFNCCRKSMFVWFWVELYGGDVGQ